MELTKRPRLRRTPPTAFLLTRAHPPSLPTVGSPPGGRRNPSTAEHPHGRWPTTRLLRTSRRGWKHPTFRPGMRESSPDLVPRISEEKGPPRPQDFRPPIYQGVGP